MCKVSNPVSEYSTFLETEIVPSDIKGSASLNPVMFVMHRTASQTNEERIDLIHVFAIHDLEKCSLQILNLSLFLFFFAY